MDDSSDDMPNRSFVSETRNLEMKKQLPKQSLQCRIGFYGIAKYLYARKKVNNIKVIDFNEGIILLGATFNFSL